jgi:hypothetical protein
VELHLPRILILSQPHDPHAFAVHYALQKKGVDSVLWFTSDFPTRTMESIYFGENYSSVEIFGPDLNIANEKFDVIWYRRPAVVMPQGVLHPSDYLWAEKCCKIFQRAVFEGLGRDAFWVNPIDGGASKLTQHFMAIDVGLRMPKSLYSNNPDRIRKFLNECPSGTIYKPFYPASWIDQSSGVKWASGTVLIESKDLVDDEITICSPGIFQEMVPKAHELRVTIFGRHVIAAKIYSQKTTKGKIDFRNAYDEIKMEECQLPEDIKQKCFEMMNRLNIVFGAFDFVVKPDGEIIFLEVNDNGQFIFIEDFCGAPVLDAFCEFLIAGSSEFEYAGLASSFVSAMTVNQTIQASFDHAAKKHILPPSDLIVESYA